MRGKSSNFRFSEALWNLWCVVSVIGLWPRFIEPRLIQTTKVDLTIRTLAPALNGLRLVQLSDLHLHSSLSDSFLRKLVDKVRRLSPDIIVFTGDFICKALLDDPSRLQRLLCQLRAPHGCFAVLGNHDYEAFVSVNEQGEYDVMTRDRPAIVQGFFRLFKKPSLKKKVTERAKRLGQHKELLKLLKQTPFTLLENASKTLCIGKEGLNIVGLGEYTLGRCRPQEAFQSYDLRYPGVVLSHNPDSVPLLVEFPGDVILCGHTHGCQINLPWFRDRLVSVENPHLRRGAHEVGEKWVYTNRGLGSVLPFRWFSVPEIMLLTLKSGVLSE